VLKIVYNRDVSGVNFRLLEEKLQHIWQKEIGRGCRELSVSFVEEGEMRNMNRTYRGKDSPTDVLSFSFLEGFEQPVPEDMPCPPIGEIIICTDIAEVEAREHGETLHQAIEKLVVHGFLHILGYEHEGVNGESANRMREKEREYLGG